MQVLFAGEVVSAGACYVLDEWTVSLGRSLLQLNVLEAKIISQEIILLVRTS